MSSLLFVIGSLDVGGAECHLVEVLPILQRRGWRVEVFCLTDRGAMAPVLEQAGIAVHAARPLRPGAGLAARAWRLIRTSVRFCTFLRERKFDIVHFFLPAAYIVGGICALVAGQHHLVCSRRSLNEYQRRHPFAAFVERRLHPRMSAVLGNSNAVLSQLAGEGVPRERLQLVYNGINTTPFAQTHGRALVRGELGIPSDGFMLVIVANLIPYKGHADLLQALAMVKNRLPSTWRLVCVGRDDGILESLVAQTRALKLSEHVIWLGARNDVPNLLAAADLGILASHEEGFSNALLEYMAAGLAVVVTDVGGNAEAVIHEKTGLVVPSRSPPDMADAIAEMAAHDDRRIAMGRAGKERVQQCFALDRCIAAYEKLYSKLLAV
jgi:glycosyltransferase involved in cell wall biosynthesis